MTYFYFIYDCFAHVSGCAFRRPEEAPDSLALQLEKVMGHCVDVGN